MTWENDSLPIENFIISEMARHMNKKNLNYK